MAVIRPFECVRPQAEKAERVAALPYDVYNREEACREVAREPLSFLKIDRAETQFDSSVDTYAPEVYAKAKELLENAIADGTFVKDSDQAYYIYELTMDGRVQTGLVACASIDDYESNVIKKHENTRADKELDRITHVDTCNAQTGPIFLAYRANAVINGEIDKAKKILLYIISCRRTESVIRYGKSANRSPLKQSAVHLKEFHLYILQMDITEPLQQLKSA